MLTVEEISKCAAGMEDLPNIELSCPDRCLYYALRDIYADYKHKRITKEEGDKRKQAAIFQHRKDVEAFSRGGAILRRQAEFWKEIEEAGSKYRKNPTIENADIFLDAVYGVGRKQNMLKEEKNESGQSNSSQERAS